MLKRFTRFIEDKKLCSPGSRVLLAVSGGPDSVVMLHLFSRAGFTIAIAHCNFQLRGDESDMDEQFVSRLAENLGIPFFSKKFDVPACMDEHGISLQEAARNLRYEWFNTLLDEKKYDHCAVAHHSSDVVETVLINMVKGTGLAGLHGIPAVNGKVIRPMLFATREEIAEYAESHQLQSRDDSSNALDKYVRNKLRHAVIPVLKEINPSLETVIAQNAVIIREAEEIIAAYIGSARETVVKEVPGCVYISIEGLKRLKSHATVLLGLLKPYGFRSPVVSDIAGALDSEPGRVFYSRTHKLVKDRTDLLVYANTAVTEEEYKIEPGTGIKYPVQLDIQVHGREELEEIKTGRETGLFDADLLNFPLTLRKWRNGDYFYPLGMSGKKKLSDFFIDRKLSLRDKESTWVLLSGEDIIWIVNERMDNRYRITEKTRNVCRIDYINYPHGTTAFI